MNDKIKQSLISLLVMILTTVTITTIYAATVYLDEQHPNFFALNLTNYNCSYCYGGKARYASQSGNYNTDYSTVGWYATNDARSAPSYFAYTPNYSGQSGAIVSHIGSNLGIVHRDINQNANKGSFQYIGGFAANIAWDDVLWTNQCSTQFSCTSWKIVWWDQVKIT